jgi:hypothetical protein
MVRGVGVWPLSHATHTALQGNTEDNTRHTYRYYIYGLGTVSTHDITLTKHDNTHMGHTWETHGSTAGPFYRLCLCSLSVLSVLSVLSSPVPDTTWRARGHEEGGGEGEH